MGYDNERIKSIREDVLLLKYFYSDCICYSEGGSLATACEEMLRQRYHVSDPRVEVTARELIGFGPGTYVDLTISFRLGRSRSRSGYTNIISVLEPKEVYKERESLTVGNVNCIFWTVATGIVCVSREGNFFSLRPDVLVHSLVSSSTQGYYKKSLHRAVGRTRLYNKHVTDHIDQAFLLVRNSDDSPTVFFDFCPLLSDNYAPYCVVQYIAIYNNRIGYQGFITLPDSKTFLSELKKLWKSYGGVARTLHIENKLEGVVFALEEEDLRWVEWRK